MFYINILPHPEEARRAVSKGEEPPEAAFLSMRLGRGFQDLV